MKKLIIIICGILFAASCNSLDDTHGQGAQNPLDECVLPSVVQAGEEALIQWNGFTENDRIYLISESGLEIEVSVKILTDSGIMFVIPAGTPAGSYKLVLEQEERKELGTMEIIAADMPVTGINIPSSIVTGEVMEIEGIGFEEGCSIRLIGENEKEYTIKATITASGISLILPEEIATGKYAIYLIQDSATWLLSSSFAVYGSSGNKELRRIDYYSPYLSGSKLRLSWEINIEEPITLTLSEYLIEDSEETLQAYDMYEADADGKFKLTHDGFESSNDLEMSYNTDSEGVVISSDVLIYGNKQTTAFTWTYDADGYLTDISSPTRSFRSLTYTDGNLTTFRNSSFEYGNPDLVNHPLAPDVAWAYMAMMESNDPFVHIPYLLRWYKKTSAQLPVAMILPSPTGSGTIRNNLTYTFDNDGYVIKMAWESSEIDFIYE